MASVCNSIAPQLNVTFPVSCPAFTEHTTYSAACGAGSGTDTCNLSISGGQAPYTTAFSYSTAPTPTNCVLNMAAFTSGTGASPQFGYGFTSSNMCSLTIQGNLTVHYTVTDALGQTATGSKSFFVSVIRTVTGGGGGPGGPGGPNPEFPELFPL